MRISRILSGALTALVLLPVPALAKTQELESLQKWVQRPNEQANARAFVQAERRDERKDERKEEKQESRANRWLEQHLRGTLTARDGNMLTLLVAGVSFRIDASSAQIKSKTNTVLTLNDLRVNDQLTVKGVWMDGGVIKAAKIEDHSIQARSGSFSGTIGSIATSSQTFVLLTNKQGSKTITWDGSTKMTKNGVSTTMADLRVGGSVRVNGTWNRDNDTVLANKIAISAPMVSVHLTGQVKAVSNGVLTVLATDEKTYQVDTRNAALVFSQYVRMKVADIQVGDSLDVWARGEQGSFVVKAYFIRNLTQMNRKTYVVTMGDLSTTRHLDIGDRLVLRLNSAYTWGNASSSNPVVLGAVTGSMMTFEAKSTGTSEVTVQGNPACLTATPACALPSVLFKVLVQVGS